ncbi:hypothetical protein M8J75_009010 [Diaphorina citri]|nr:hypothetical protein M8J75_009010 [Diaphorina citri]KAI5708337.1 hypothetical protein M8J77_020827 [Diaphorina citri]
MSTKQAKKIVCKLCKELYPSKDPLALNRHLYARHTGSKAHVCESCGKKFSDKKGLVRHLLHVHFEYRPYKCQLCPQVFSRRDKYLLHMRRKHPTVPPVIQMDEPVSAESDEESSDTCPSSTPTNTFNADENTSPQSSRTKKLNTNSTSQSMNLNNSDQGLQCVLCKAKIKPQDRSALSKHLYLKHIKADKCEKCGKVYADRKGLVRHYIHVHFQYKPYSCKHCNRCFARKDHLRNHQMMHHIRQGTVDKGDGEVFECDNCHKFFVKKDSLERHNLICMPSEGKVNVERILDKREVNGKVEYLIKWEGYSENQSTWESEECITGVRRPDENEDENGEFSDNQAEMVESMDDSNETEGDSDQDAYLDEIYLSPHMPHINIGV